MDLKERKKPYKHSHPRSKNIRYNNDGDEVTNTAYKLRHALTEANLNWLLLTLVTTNTEKNYPPGPTFAAVLAMLLMFLFRSGRV